MKVDLPSKLRALGLLGLPVLHVVPTAGSSEVDLALVA
jgi:hypothetical protein